MIYSLAKKCPNSQAALLALAFLNTHGVSGAAIHNGALRQVAHFPASGLRPQQRKLADLLPISPVSAEIVWEGVASECDESLKFLHLKFCLAVLSSLNFLMGVGWTSRPILPVEFVPLTVAQMHSLSHISVLVADFLQVSDSNFSLSNEVSALKQKRVSYSGSVVSVRRDLISNLVEGTWPRVGQACVCNILLYIDQHLVDDLQGPKRCLLAVEDWPEVTPSAKVYASDAEWYKLCMAGHKRGMFVPVARDSLFYNQFGEPVLNGAIGVDKFKEVDGQEIRLLRFIAILTPLNSYMRKLAGDSNTLPLANFLSKIILSDIEVMSLDGEDMHSCFNLFFLPEQWWGYFAFEKQVDASVFGGAAGSMTHVGLRCVPMGWINSVDVIQNFIRRFVFGTCAVCVRHWRSHPIKLCLKETQQSSAWTVLT